MIGERITQLIEEYGWTQSTLAERIGTSQAYISQLCNNTRKPSMSMLEKISEAFGLKPDDLLRHESQSAQDTGIMLAVSSRENALIAKYRLLAKRDQDAVHALIDALSLPGKGQYSTSMSGEVGAKNDLLA